MLHPIEVARDIGPQARLIDGGAGDDRITGLGGDDTLLGGEGTDQLIEAGDVDFMQDHGAEMIGEQVLAYSASYHVLPGAVR